MSGLTQNCSLCEMCNSISLWQVFIAKTMLFRLCDSMLVLGAVILIYLLYMLIASELNIQKFISTLINFNPRRFLQIVLLTISLLFLPILMVLLILVLIYKVICSVIIIRKDKRFVKFLDSFDVFYCLEGKDTTDLQGVIQSTSIEIAVENIEEKLRNVFNNYSTDKMFYRKTEEYGFYYWRKYSCIDLTQYVQIVEIPKLAQDDKNIAEHTTGKADTIETSNDQGLFKVLIMKHEHETMNHQFRIVIKFHNTVKVSALVQFMSRLIEKDDTQVTIALSPNTRDYDSPDALMNMIRKLCSILAQAVDVSELRNDYNLQELSLRSLKTFKWTKSDDNLLSRVNIVKDSVCEINFANIISETLARALRNLEL